MFRATLWNYYYLQLRSSVYLHCSRENQRLDYDSVRLWLSTFAMRQVSYFTVLYLRSVPGAATAYPVPQHSNKANGPCWSVRGGRMYKSCSNPPQNLVIQLSISPLMSACTHMCTHTHTHIFQETFPLVGCELLRHSKRVAVSLTLPGTNNSALSSTD